MHSTAVRTWQEVEMSSWEFNNRHGGRNEALSLPLLSAGIRRPYLLTFTLATTAFSAGAARNRTDLEALILIASPVAGFRPLRAARSVTVNVPRAENEKRPSFFSVVPTTPNT